MITAEKCNEAPYRLWQDPAGNRNQGLHTYPSVPDLSRAAYCSSFDRKPHESSYYCSPCKVQHLREKQYQM